MPRGWSQMGTLQQQEKIRLDIFEKFFQVNHMVHISNKSENLNQECASSSITVITWWCECVLDNGRFQSEDFNKC